MKRTGTIISLAWPDTMVVKVGMWYDVVMTWLGFAKEDYYKVGHAATVLVDHTTGELHYFDFGRYHTPLKHGRVRDKITDPDLAIHQKAKTNEDGAIENLENILLEVAANEATHGDGKMLASVYTGIDFQSAYQKAKALQEKEAIHYGPLDPRGTNCSRFVATVAKASGVGPVARALLACPYTISPTPVFNIRVATDQPFYYEVNNGSVFRKRQIWSWLKPLSNRKQRQSVAFKEQLT